MIGEGQIALGEVEAGAAALRACEPYLMEADPLAIVEIVGMAGQASIWVEDWDARVADPLARARRGPRRERRLRADPPARRPGPPRSAPRPLGAALAGASEAAELAEDTGQLALLPHALAALTLVEAGLGHETDCRRHVARGLELAGGDADGVYLHAALGLLELGLGRIPEAIEALETGDRQMRGAGSGSTVVQLRPDLIEAYVRAGRREEAEAMLARLEERRSACTGRRVAAAARCRALLAPDDEVRGRVRRRARAARRAADAVRARPDTARARASGCAARSSAPRRASR